MKTDLPELESSKSKVVKYFIFLAITSIVLILISFRSDFLLAPPYAVSAYLIVFSQKSHRYNGKSVVAAYLLVIAGSDLAHIIAGANVAGMLLNVIIVSAFITFTNLSHPPAIALSIFSYITNSPLDFTISSLLALMALVISTILLGRYSVTK
jgi:hypothetical protein